MTFKIEIYSDAICPWCYIGKRRFAKALHLLSEDYQAQVTWRPFELNPEMPPEGIERKQYRSTKFGSWGESQAMDARMTQLGAAEGVSFAFDRMERTPNTFEAHRLTWLAQQEGVQDAVVEGLFRVYFTEGRDIGQPSTLLEIATEAGMAPDRVKAFLESTEGAAGVREEEQQGYKLGITGVPFFVIDEKYGLSGAQPPEVIVDTLRQIGAKK